MSDALSRNRIYAGVLLAVALLACSSLLAWPLLAPAHSATSTSLFALPIFVVPIAVGLLLNELVSHHLTVKAIAIAGIVVALAAVLRPLGAGVAGIEPMWVIIIVAARAFGSATDFVIAVSSIVVSALATGGVGPWLPYQVSAAGLMAIFAGLLPQWRGKLEVILLVVYSALASFFFGWLMNLWFWQSLSGLQPALAYDPAAASSERIRAWITYNLTTSVGFDLPRAIFTATLVALAASPLLSTLRRANRTFSHMTATDS